MIENVFKSARGDGRGVMKGDGGEWQFPFRAGGKMLEDSAKGFRG